MKYICPYCKRKTKRNKHTKSCGCVRNELISQTLSKHGDYRTKLYAVWISMNSRCRNKNNRLYGMRNIQVCIEWSEFIVFRSWALEEGYREGLYLDRLDNNLGYYPRNCRWATPIESGRNTRAVKLSIEKAIMIRDLYNRGIDYSYLAKMFKVNYETIRSTVKHQYWKE